MSDKLIINEIFSSIQGESSYAGRPCTFIRLTGCPRRCRWCDTEYAYDEGKELSIDEIIAEVKKAGIDLVQITGGEPLSQKRAPELIERLSSSGYDVLLETSGTVAIDSVSKISSLHIVMDIKCPGSEMDEFNVYDNLEKLKPTDDLKFVLSSREDFDFALSLIRKLDLEKKLNIFLSPVFGELDPKDLADWTLSEKLKCKVQLQLHKYIWDPKKRGV